MSLSAYLCYVIDFSKTLIVIQKCPNMTKGQPFFPWIIKPKSEKSHQEFLSISSETVVLTTSPDNLDEYLSSMSDQESFSKAVFFIISKMI